LFKGRQAALVTAFLAVTAFTAPAAGQNAASHEAEPANMRELVAAAAREGTLNVAYGAVYGGADGTRAIQDAIDKRYHINLTIHYSPISAGVPFETQLIQEVKAGQPTSSDIMFSLTSASWIPYVQRIDWRKYVPGLPEDVMIYDRHAVAMYTALYAFDYNTKLIPRDQVPRTFADLLKPQWKGKIATSPYQGVFLNYIGLPQMMGHQGMLDFVNKFAAQLSGIMVCGEIDRVVSGEFLIYGLDCGDYEVRKRQRKGLPIAAFYPKEGTSLNYVAPAIPNTSAHPNAARLFIAFLLTREGQDLLWKYAAADSDRLPGSHMAAIMADLRRQGVKFIDTTGRDMTYPELSTYAAEINKIVNQGR
jgi:ABC-type Fe3+ transport system substrate-binding protein